jgi:hypothetical protein
MQTHTQNNITATFIIILCNVNKEVHKNSEGWLCFLPELFSVNHNSILYLYRKAESYFQVLKVLWTLTNDWTLSAWIYNVIYLWRISSLSKYLLSNFIHVLPTLEMLLEIMFLSSICTAVTVILMSSNELKWDLFNIFSFDRMKSHRAKSGEYGDVPTLRFALWPEITLPKLLCGKAYCYDANFACLVKDYQKCRSESYSVICKSCFSQHFHMDSKKSVECLVYGRSNL